MVQTCLYVERRPPHVHLSGVGVNPSLPLRLRAEAHAGGRCRSRAGHRPPGGGRHRPPAGGWSPARRRASSYPMIHAGTMPAGISHLPDRRKYSDGAGCCHDS
ncbi:MAG: hypothetical protein ACLU38_00765 [Dysosmobacter sp.]